MLNYAINFNYHNQRNNLCQCALYLFRKLAFPSFNKPNHKLKLKYYLKIVDLYLLYVT